MSADDVAMPIETPVVDRDFDAEFGDEEIEQGETFRFCGQVFQLRSNDDIPFGTLARIYRQLREGNKEEVALQIGPLFRSVLTSESGVRFVEMMEEDDSRFTGRKLQPVVEWIFTQVTGRPTKPLRSSPAGPKRTGRNSRVVSSSRATNPKASSA